MTPIKLWQLSSIAMVFEWHGTYRRLFPTEKITNRQTKHSLYLIGGEQTCRNVTGVDTQCRSKCRIFLNHTIFRLYTGYFKIPTATSHLAAAKLLEACRSVINEVTEAITTGLLILRMLTLGRRLSSMRVRSSTICFYAFADHDLSKITMRDEL